MPLAEWFLQLFAVLDDEGWGAIKQTHDAAREGEPDRVAPIMESWTLAEEICGVSRTPWYRR